MTAPVAAPDETTEQPADPAAAAARQEQSSASTRPAPLPPTPLRPDATTPATPTPVTPSTTTTPKTSQPAGATQQPAKPAADAKTDQTKTSTPTDAETDATKTDATKTEGAKRDTKAEAAKGDTKTDTDKADTPATPTDSAALNNLASVAPQLAGPLLTTALGVPAAALQGAGQMLPGLTGAVMPTLAALMSQLGTGPTPATPTGRISTTPDTLAGTLGGLAGTGDAADAARTETQTAADRAAALRTVDKKLADILGLSSAKTDTARHTLKGVIYDVETALIAAAAQGDTPQAQALVLNAMRHALDKAGTIVSDAARDKMTDAAFVRTLIADYLHTSTTGTGADHLMAGTSSRGAAAVAAARRYLGTPYVWGGGGAFGPTKGGFDCSGLTQYAIAKATGGRMILPRTTYEQIRSGRPVTLGALRPGDLIFSNFSSPGVPEHVQLYIGGGQVIEAPQRGVPVQISAVPANAQACRVL